MTAERTLTMHPTRVCLLLIAAGLILAALAYYAKGQT